MYKKRNVFIYGSIVLLIVLFVLNVAQVLRYNLLVDETNNLVGEQRKIIDLQKKMLRDLRILESPARTYSSVDGNNLKTLEMEDMVLLDIYEEKDVETINDEKARRVKSVKGKARKWQRIMKAKNEE